MTPIPHQKPGLLPRQGILCRRGRERSPPLRDDGLHFQLPPTRLFAGPVSSLRRRDRASWPRRVTATVTSTCSWLWSNVLGGLCMSSSISAILSNTLPWWCRGIHQTFPIVLNQPWLLVLRGGISRSRRLVRFGDRACLSVPLVGECFFADLQCGPSSFTCLEVGGDLSLFCHFIPQLHIPKASNAGVKRFRWITTTIILAFDLSLIVVREPRVHF